jgi:hypothetical protein
MRLGAPEFSSSSAWSRICSSAMSTKLLASSTCGQVFDVRSHLGDEKGSALGGPLFLRLFVAGTGFEPVTSGL